VNVPERNPGERGIALVVALLVLLVVTILGVVLMTTVTIGRRTAGNDLRASDALNVSEAGVSEAMALIRHGDINLSTSNPRAVAQVFLASAGSVPSLGTDSVGVATRQPAGSWLSYSTTTRGPDALTVQFKTDPGRTVIYKYDGTATPRINTTTGLPIYQIISTGTVGSARRKVITEVIQKPFYANARAALAAGHDIRFIGNAVVCGFNHTADTPNDAGENRRGNAPDCIPHETGGGDLPAAWSTDSIVNGGAAYQNGAAPIWAAGQTGFYTGPWDAFNMSQADFLAWIGTPVSGLSNNLNGIYYVDNNATVGDQSANLGIHGGDGEGMLYVDGDLTINAQFYYRGLIYVEGDLKMNGQAWVLGGIIVKGRSTVRQNGGATILYSSEAIARALARYGGQFVTLSWREIQP
jgi:Tfp pilus assembly protein PilX